MGAYTLLQDLTVSSNSTSVVLNDFGTITKDDFIKVVTTFANPTSSARDIFLFPNTNAGVSGHNTNTNYHAQSLFGSGSSVASERRNNNYFDFQSGNHTGSTFAFIKMSENGKYNCFVNNTLRNTSDVLLHLFYTTSNNLTFNDPITSLTFTAAVTNGIGTGSRIQIYKLAAEKVADFTVATNSTQVDIPFPTGTFDPAIDKDSEYLLVSDVLPVGGGVLYLTPNDLTTTSGYRSQGIAGNGTTKAAFRLNNPTYMECGSTDVRDVAHTHIKLSNIGAFTAQSYEMVRSGSNGVFLENFFVSSTAENITSITKLNIVSSASNAIKAGSRFILYKLYE